MENSARYATIGAFAILAVTAMFGFVYWFSIAGKSGMPKPYDIVFKGAVTGLTTGGNVLFNGIKVGQVENLRIDPMNPKNVIARIEVNDTTPVKTDTKARLEFQGLTGVGFVQLTGGSFDAADLEPGPEQEVARIVAEKSDFQTLVEGVKSTLEQASESLGRIDKLLDDNSAKISSTIDNVQKFSGALADNSDGVKNFLTSMSTLGEQAVPLVGDLRGLSQDVRKVVDAIPPEEVSKTVANVSKFAETLGENSHRVNIFFKDVGDLALNLKGLSEGLQSTIGDLSEIADSIDPKKIETSVANVEKFTSALGGNAERVDEIARNADEMVTKLNAAASRIDGILDKVDAMVSGDEGEGLFSELSETAKSIRVLAEKLDKRTAVITSDVTKLTGMGVRDYGALAGQAQQTLRRIERLISDIDRDPSRLIFGGEKVREYKRQ